MTTYTIQFLPHLSVKAGLQHYVRVEDKPVVLAQRAVVNADGDETEPEVKYQPAKFHYEPAYHHPIEFEIESDEKEGMSIFEEWLRGDNISVAEQLERHFDIKLEYAVKTFSYEYTVTHSGTLDPDTVIENDITDESSAEEYIANHIGDNDALCYPDEELDMTRMEEEYSDTKIFGLGESAGD